MQRTIPPLTERDKLLANYRANRALPYQLSLRDFLNLDLRHNQNIALKDYAKKDFFDPGGKTEEAGIQQLAKDLLRDVSVNGDLQTGLLVFKELHRAVVQQQTLLLLTQLLNTPLNFLIRGYSQGPAAFIPCVLSEACLGEKYKIIQPQARIINLVYDPKLKKICLDFYAESFPIIGDAQGVLTATVKARFIFTEQGTLNKEIGCELVSVETDCSEIYLMLKGQTYTNETFPVVFARFLTSDLPKKEPTLAHAPPVAMLDRYSNLLRLLNDYQKYALKKLAKLKLTESELILLATQLTNNQYPTYHLEKNSLDLCRKYAYARSFLHTLLEPKPFTERFARLEEQCNSAQFFMSQHRSAKFFSTEGSKLIEAIREELTAIYKELPKLAPA